MKVEYRDRLLILVDDIHRVFDESDSKWVVTSAMEEFEVKQPSQFQHLSKSSRTKFNSDTVVYTEMITDSTAFESRIEDIYDRPFNITSESNSNEKWPILFIDPYDENFIGFDIMSVESHFESILDAVNFKCTIFAYPIFLTLLNDFGIVVSQPVLNTERNVTGVIMRAFTVPEFFRDVEYNHFIRKFNLDDFEIEIYSKTSSSLIIDIDEKIFVKEKDHEIFQFDINNITSIKVSVPKWNHVTRQMTYILTIVIGFILSVLLGIIISLLIKKNRDDSESKFKWDFISSISHEMRTPLNGIMSMAETVFNSQGFPIIFNENMNIILSCGQNLVGMVDDIVDMSKVRAKMITPNPSVFEMSPCIQFVTRNLWNGLRRYGEYNKDVRVILRIQQGFPSKIKVDKHMVKQVYRNVFSNAVKFTQTGEIDVNVSINYAPGDSLGSLVKITVSDTGIGMDKSTVNNLFQPFKRMHGDSTLQGTGLGLTISKSISRLLGGDILCKHSSPGEGSVFEFTFRANVSGECSNRVIEFVYVNDVIAPPVITESLNFKHDYSLYSVLIVDDNNINVTVLQMMLGSFTSKVYTCSDGERSIKMCGSKKYDLILMDVHMPGMSGIDACKSIRKNGLNMSTPIVFVTADTTEKTSIMCKDVGGDLVIYKPVGRKVILNILEKFIVERKISV